MKVINRDPVVEFENIASVNSSKTALIYQGKIIDYKTLNEKANAVAAEISNYALPADTPIAIYCKSGISLAIGLLGILKSGHPYTPLDITYPDERNNSYVSMSGAELVLCEEGLEFNGIKPKCFFNENIVGISKKPKVQQSDIAYYIYTSGSTGVPKKIPTLKSTLYDSLQCIEKKIKLLPDDIVLSKTSLCFAFSTVDFFYPLIKGCTMVLAEQNQSKDPSYIASLIKSENITVFTAVPAFLQMLLQENEFFSCRQIRCVISSAGLMKQSTVDAFMTQFPGCQLYHCFGMSEMTSIVCAALCRKGGTDAYVPLENWLDGIDCYILDENGNESDYGVLYLGGVSLNIIECDDAGLAEKRYIKNPFSSQDKLLYRTGDIFRLIDGKMHYVGRADNMVKISGNRIEPEEIENVLALIPFIQDVCVCAEANREYLAAYIVLSDSSLESAETVEQLRETCRSKLPAYMVPSVFRFVDEMAHLPNGKLDRASMNKIPYRVVNGRRREFETSTQLELAEMWEVVLGHRDFGAEDAFLLCGGTSIQIMRLRAAIIDKFSVNITLAELMDIPTVREQAEYIDHAEKNYCEQREYFTDRDMTGDIPLSEQQRAFFTGMQSDYTAGNASTYGYAELFCTKYNQGKMEEALKLISDVHPMLRSELKDDSTLTIRDSLYVEYHEASDRDEFDTLCEQMRYELNGYVPAIHEPLVKICILTLGSEALFQLYFNTIAMDGMSYTILCRDFRKAYLEGKLPSVNYNFRNYLDFLEYKKTTQEYKTAEVFWEEKVQDFNSNPMLPFKNNLEELESIRGTYRYVVLEDELVEEIKAEALSRRISLFSCMFAAYAKTVALYNGGSNFVICIPVEHRDSSNSEADRMLGACSSFVYLKIDDSIYLPFYDAAAKLQEQLYQCRNMSAFSGVELTRTIHKYHSEIQNTPMVIFTSLLENQEDDDMWNCVHAQSHTSQSCLETVVQKIDNKVHIVINSFNGLFRETTLDGMAETYYAVLKDRAALPIISKADNLLLAKMNDTKRDIGEETVMERILYNLEHNGDKVALCTMSEQYTYAELYDAVKKAVTVLRENDAEAGDRIGVILKKGVGQFVWALAITFYGCVYMPLEYDITEVQAVKIMKNAGAHICVVYDESQYAFSQNSITQIHDSDWHKAKPAEKLPDISPNGEIIIIHTSGTTGNPKGVLLRERNLRNTLVDTMPLYGVTADDRAIALTNTAHDLSLFDLFGMMMVGGSVAIPDADRYKDPAHWYELCRATQPTVWNSVPTIMEMFAEYTEFSNCEPLESFQLNIHGGEFVPLSLPERIHAIEPNARIISIGGPTETTIWNVCHNVSDQDVANGIIPYGKPMANTHYYFLDDQMNQVPAYVQAVMYISGYSVAEGYVNCPEETAEKFTKHPVTKERIYCSGDVGYYTENGEICIVGRKDNQIKLFGKRIELEGIEYTIEQQDKIENVKVCVEREEGFLAAFFKASEKIHIPTLIADLSELLPSYMIPKYFMQVDSFPFLPNGKIDRKALLAALVREDEEETDFSVLGKIRQIFIDVLAVQQIENDSNFFFAGGNSIKAIHIVQQIQMELNCKILLSDFLQNPTIEHMYELTINCRSQKQLAGITFRPEPEQMYEPFPLQELQASYLIGRQNDLQLGNITTHGYIEITCDDYDDGRFKHALKRLGERHPIFSCAVYNDHQQFLTEPLAPVIETEYLSEMNEEEFQEYLQKTRKDLTGSFLDPQKPPLVRIKISHLNAKQVIIHMYLDSLIIDGWSYEILYSELEQLYADPDAELEPIAITFRDYVNYREAFRESEIYQRDRQYWMERIDTLSDPISIPLLKKPEEITDVTGNLKLCYLSFEQWRKLEKNARSNGVSPFSVLFTSFALVLARWNQKQNFLLSIPEYDRPEFHPDIKKIAGVCTSFLIFDMDNRPHESFLEVVKRVQRQIWELNEHHSFTGLEVMREICRRNNAFGQAHVPIVFSSFLDIPQTEKQYLKPYYSETHTSQIYIDIDTMVCGDRVEFNWNAIKGLMDDDMLTDMTELQMQILNNAADDKEFWDKECVLELPERDRKIIEASNKTDRPFEYQSMAKLIDSSMVKNSKRICMVDDTRSYTYAEIRKMILERCTVLQKKGIEAGNHVGILCMKTVTMYSYILACIYRGITYVPLEYDYPASIVEQCFESTGCKAVVTDRTDVFQKNEMVKISPDETDVLYDSMPYDNSEDYIFVIIHTSGSTGIPKAVKVGAMGLENALVFSNRHFGVNHNDSILAVTNIAHDMSMFDLFGLLLAGGKICIVGHEYRRNAEYWLSVMEREQITIWNSVPAMMEMMLMVMKPYQTEVIRNLKFVVSGGDYLALSTVKTIRSCSPDTVIYNVGGPTETTLWNIYHEISEKDIASEILPYGNPIDNTRYYILNEKLEEVPVGVIGKMYCAGIGITYGYENNPEETTERYIIYPKTGERIYCTGDLGCYDNDGRILFKGREDNQIKINGKRIELDGIIQVMESYEKINKAHVMVGDDKRQMTAFYSADEPIAAETLQNYLRSRLPMYMMPHRYIYLEKIPLNAVGKPDKKAMLAAAEQIPDEQMKQKQLPADILENGLRQMCRELLDDNTYQVNSNFFLSGGNSISAIHLLAMVREKYKIEISLTEILQNPVITGWHEIILQRLLEKIIAEENIIYK